MVLRVSCSVGGLTFSRNFFKPLLPRHIWRKIQLESDSLPYNQLIFLFSYRFFFTTGPTSNPQKTSSRLIRSRLPLSGWLLLSYYFILIERAARATPPPPPLPPPPRSDETDPTRRTRRDGPSDKTNQISSSSKPTRRTTNSTFSRTEDEHSITTIQ